MVGYHGTIDRQVRTLAASLAGPQCAGRDCRNLGVSQRSSRTVAGNQSKANTGMTTKRYIALGMRRFAISEMIERAIAVTPHHTNLEGGPTRIRSLPSVPADVACSRRYMMYAPGTSKLIQAANRTGLQRNPFSSWAGSHEQLFVGLDAS
jgi:hypothetical protein